MGKFKARYVVIPLICLLGAGAVAGIISVRSSKNVVNVAPVSEIIAEYSYMDDVDSGDKFYGKLQKGSFANVKADRELKIESVNVKKGDTVKKGDVLISYDIHSLEDSVADAELQIKTITNEIQILDNDLSVLRVLQPSENAPEDYVPDDEDEETPDAPDEKEEKKSDTHITDKTVPLAGTGSASDPLIYTAEYTTVIDRSALILFADEESPLTAVVYVMGEDGSQLYSLLVDGSKIDRTDVSDFSVNSGVTLTPDGMISYSGSGVAFVSFLTMGGQSIPEQPSELPEDFEMPENIELPEAPAEDPSAAQNYELSVNDNYKYSAKDIRDMISEKEKEKETLILQKKQAELDVRTAKHKAETGGEVAAIDGKVTFVAKDIYHLSESGAYITVTNDSGMSVTSTIGEFSLNKISEGREVKITNFETGAMCSGTITDISDTPAEAGSLQDQAGGGMESQYSFTVTLSEDLEISEDSEVQISVPTETGGDGFIISGTMVRSEGGRFYVYAVGEDGLLEKRYVTVGSIMYEEYYITDGLTADDFIAFPYGNAAEGMPVNKTDYNTVYFGASLFY